jgi:hypothetical protein
MSWNTHDYFVLQLFRSVVIDNLDFAWTGCGPNEADAVLIVYPNAVLARPIASE